MPKEYVNERQELYNTYRPVEIDNSMDPALKNELMIEWWKKHIGLYVKYKLSENVVKEAAKNPNIMKFREGAKDFLGKMNEKEVPVIILSAGIGNFITQFLIDNNCLSSNIFILANYIEFNNGKAIGIKDGIIHAINKNEISLCNDALGKTQNKKNIILFGDSIGDIKMVDEEKREQTLSVGFLEEKPEKNEKYFRETFDIVCTNGTSFHELFKTLELF